MASLKAKDALISINGEQISAQIVAGLLRKKSKQKAKTRNISSPSGFDQLN